MVIPAFTFSNQFFFLALGIGDALGTKKNNNNSSSSNHQDGIFSAVIISSRSLREVHLMNVEQRQATADPQTKPPDLGL